MPSHVTRNQADALHALAAARLPALRLVLADVLARIAAHLRALAPIAARLPALCLVLADARIAAHLRALRLVLADALALIAAHHHALADVQAHPLAPIAALLLAAALRLALPRVTTDADTFRCF